MSDCDQCSAIGMFHNSRDSTAVTPVASRMKLIVIDSATIARHCSVRENI